MAVPASKTGKKSTNSPKSISRMLSHVVIGVLRTEYNHRRTGLGRDPRVTLQGQFAVQAIDRDWRAPRGRGRAIRRSSTADPLRWVDCVGLGEQTDW